LAQAAREREAAQRKVAGTIFERAREVFDLCIAAVGDATDRSGVTRLTVWLTVGRFERSDFDKNLNEWNMAVLALREHLFSAELVFAESDERDEMTGGFATVYTPGIKLSWEKRDAQS
jgi:hypothetical protein